MRDTTQIQKDIDRAFAVLSVASMEPQPYTREELSKVMRRLAIYRARLARDLTDAQGETARVCQYWINKIDAMKDGK